MLSIFNILVSICDILTIILVEFSQSFLSSKKYLFISFFIVSSMFDIFLFSTKVILVFIFIGFSWTVSTVTKCPIGASPIPFCSLFGHICSWTFSINCSLALLKLLSIIVNSTVPPPCQIGITFTAPTPDISFVFFL